MLHPSFAAAIQQSWCKETAAPEYQAHYHLQDPAFGQSLVTSLAVWTVCGGKIAAGHTMGNALHFRNEIQGQAIDLASAQFLPANPIATRVIMQQAFRDNTLYSRLRILTQRIEENGFEHPYLKADAILRHFKLSHPNLFRENTQPRLQIARP